MPLGDLRALWTKHIGGAPPPLRRLLVRELAWRTQARSRGGLDADTRRLLEAALRAAVKAHAGARTGDPASRAARAAVRAAPGASGPPRRYRPVLTPSRKSPTGAPPGSRLIRTWRGVKHEVLVLEGRAFRYRDQTYGSLTEIAREITGTRWSGPRFFGLSTRAKRSEGSDGPGTVALKIGEFDL